MLLQHIEYELFKKESKLIPIPQFNSKVHQVVGQIIIVFIILIPLIWSDDKVSIV